MQLHRTGQEFIVDYIFTDGATRPSSVDIGLFNNSTDSLAETDDLSAITTEPTGANYSRITASFPGDFTNSNDGSGWYTITASKQFDSSDSSQSVDSFFVVINFDSDEAGDGGVASDHLFWTDQLSQTYDLGSVDTFDLQAGLKPEAGTA